jgi:hypothetical protein
VKVRGAKSVWRSSEIKERELEMELRATFKEVLHAVRLAYNIT